MDMLCELYVRTVLKASYVIMYQHPGRFSTKVPDPFLGPKGVRLLLVVRGFVGYVLLT